MTNTMMEDFLTYLMDDDTATGALKTLQESTKKQSGSSNVYYRYKRMLEGSSATVRFLPISQDVMELEARPRFWLPKKVIRLRFDNPLQEGSEVVLTIPVMQMFVNGKTEDDIVLKQVKALYDEADALLKKGQEERSKEVRSTGSYHWMRGECLAQGFVVRSGFTENEVPENPLRIFELTKQIMNVIQASVNSDDEETRLTYWPVHGKKGTNFVIKKTKSGEWPSYTQSCFSRQTSPLTTEQIDGLRTHGLYKLEDFLPKRASDAEYEVMAQIVAASIAGNRIWDPDFEAHLDKSRIYKTNQPSHEEDDEANRARVQETVAAVGSSVGSTTDVLAKLNRTGRQSEESAQPEAAALSDVEPVEVDNSEPKADTRSIIDKIRKSNTKTATAAAAD